MTTPKIEEIIASNEKALKEERTRKGERLPNADDNVNPVYPLRSTQEYPGGHRQVFDSTPGHRIVETTHGSGTFQQWSEDGTEIKVVVGQKYESLKQGYTLTIGQNGDIVIQGHCRVAIEGGAHIEVKGDIDLITTGNMTQLVSGNYKLAVGGNYEVSVDGNINQTSGEKTKHKSGGRFDTESGGAMKHKSHATMDLQSDGNMTERAPRIDLNP